VGRSHSEVTRFKTANAECLVSIGTRARTKHWHHYIQFPHTTLVPTPAVHSACSDPYDSLTTLTAMSTKTPTPHVTNVIPSSNLRDRLRIHPTPPPALTLSPHEHTYQGYKAAASHPYSGLAPSSTSRPATPDPAPVALWHHRSTVRSVRHSLSHHHKDVERERKHKHGRQQLPATRSTDDNNCLGTGSLTPLGPGISNTNTRTLARMSADDASRIALPVASGQLTHSLSKLQVSLSRVSHELLQYISID
jgi:hypothetical protein